MAEAYTTHDGNIGNRVYTPTETRPNGHQTTSRYPEGVLRDLGVTAHQMEDLERDIDNDLPELTRAIMIREARQRFFDNKFIQWQGDTRKINGHIAGNYYVTDKEAGGKIDLICVQTFTRHRSTITSILSRWYRWRANPAKRLVSPLSTAKDRPALLTESPIGRSVMGHMIVAVTGKDGSHWMVLLDNGYPYMVRIKDLEPITDIQIRGKYDY